MSAKTTRLTEERPVRDSHFRAQPSRPFAAIRDASEPFGAERSQLLAETSLTPLKERVALADLWPWELSQL